MNKTTRLAAVFAFCALAFCGCSGKKADASQVDGQMLALLAEEGVQQVAEESQYNKKVDSVMIYAGWTLYRENSEGKMIASAETRVGDSVRLYCKDSDGSKPEEKKAIRRLQNGEEKELTFVRLSFDDEDYWTRPIFVAKQAWPGAMTKSGRLFSAPDMATMTKTVVEEGSIMAKSSADSEKDFACVFVYDGNPYGKKMYVQDESISTYVHIVEKYATLARVEELGDELKPEVWDELEIIIEKIGDWGR